MAVPTEATPTAPQVMPAIRKPRPELAAGAVALVMPSCSDEATVGDSAGDAGGGLGAALGIAGVYTTDPASVLGAVAASLARAWAGAGASLGPSKAWQSAMCLSVSAFSLSL